MSSTFKRATTILLTLAMSIGLCFGLAACGGGSNDEAAIKSELDKALGVLKNPTQESLTEMLGNDTSSLDSLQQYGIDGVEMLQHLFAKFDYSIDSVKVDGDAATAQLTLTNIDLQSVISEFTTDMNSDAEFTSQIVKAYQSGGEAEAYKLIFDKLFEYIDNSDELVTSTAELKLNKVDGEWQIDEDSQTEMVSAMYGGVDLSSL